ncbi:MAG: lipoyl(octanoyl) transferase LipB [Petrimonas sp.]|nr:lipoyl(octanoyl) transferase LipB [Petrimonas sp.]
MQRIKNFCDFERQRAFSALSFFVLCYNISMNLIVNDLGGGCGYTEVFELQKQLHAERVAGRIPDTLLLLEHAPVYTLGTSASESHVLFDAEQLRSRGIDLVKTSRGGDVTYHGPGQLVGYPIVHLKELNLKVLDYITALEEVIIRCVSLYNVKAGRDQRNRGVWVGNSKLAAIGIRVSRQVAMHGFALNIKPHLSDYNGIVACGLNGVGVTSLQQLATPCPDVNRVKEDITAQFLSLFNYKCE